MLALPTGAAGMMGSSLATTTIGSAVLLSSVLIPAAPVETAGTISIRGSAVDSLLFTTLELETEDPSELLTAVTGEAGNSVKPFDFEALFPDFMVEVLFPLPIDGNFSILDPLTLPADESGPIKKKI